MEGFPTLPLSQGEAAKEYARKMAKFSGKYKFIWLTLNNSRIIRISGIEDVVATPYNDEINNQLKFHLDIKGGSIQFEFSPERGVYRYAMVDTEHNRKFLASHFHLDFWVIDDENIRSEIAKMSKVIEEDLKNNPLEKTPIDPIFQDAEDRSEGDDKNGKRDRSKVKRGKKGFAEDAEDPVTSEEKSEGDKNLQKLFSEISSPAIVARGPGVVAP